MKNTARPRRALAAAAAALALTAAASFTTAATPNAIDARLNIPLTVGDIDSRYLNRDAHPLVTELLRSTIGFRLPSLDNDDLAWIGDHNTAPDTDGKFVVIQSWSRENAKSRTIPTRVERLVSASRIDEVVFVSLHTPTDESELRDYLSRRRTPANTAVDTTGAFADLLAIHEEPTTIIADRDGRIRLAGASPSAVSRALRVLASEDPDHLDLLGDPDPLPTRQERIDRYIDHNNPDATEEQKQAIQDAFDFLRFQQPDGAAMPPFAELSRATNPNASTDVSDGLRDVIRRTGAKLVYANGTSVSAEQQLAGKELVFLYNSAGWCGPCRRFTPTLVDFYEDNGGGERFEVILVSHDRTLADAADYMKDAKMPWAMASLQNTPQLRTYRTGGGIPDLVLMDAATGEVIMTSYTKDGQFVGPNAVLDEARRRLGA